MTDKPNDAEQFERTPGRRKWPDDWQDDDRKDSGVRCPKCHCRDMRVSHVRDAPNGSRWRRRVCRHCGHVRCTYEK